MNLDCCLCLHAVVDSGTTDIQDVVSICQKIQKKYPTADIGEITQAKTIIEGYAALKGQGRTLARLSEEVEMASTGREREYLHDWQAGCLVSLFARRGGVSSDAIADALGQRRSSGYSGLVIFEDLPEYKHSGRMMRLRISEKELPIDILTDLLVAEIAEACKGDPRNEEFVKYVSMLDEKARIRSFEKYPRLYPVVGSNYYIKVVPDRHLHKIKSAGIVLANSEKHGFEFSYKRRPNVKHEISRLCNAGYPVKIDGKHESRQKGKHWVLVPEWEIDSPHEKISLFGISVESSRILRSTEESDCVRGRRYRKRVGDVKFEGLHVEAGHADYFGVERCAKLLCDLKGRIEQRFGLNSGNILRYADSVQARALAPPGVPMLESGK